MNNIDNALDTANDGTGGRDRGFTLVEILIAIVLVGVLSAVVVVGISSLTKQGSASACTASLDAAKAGTVVYYASHQNTYPLSFTELTTGTSTLPAALTLSSGVMINSTDNRKIAQGTSWILTMTNGVNGAAPTFSCSS